MPVAWGGTGYPAHLPPCSGFGAIPASQHRRTYGGRHRIFIGSNANGQRQQLELKRANRHGLIAGATGTGKTVTIQGIIDGLSAAGVPCFVADVKGDLSGLAMAGSPTSKMHEIFAARASEIGYDDLALCRQSRAVLGSVRRAGPSDPHHRLGNGPASPRRA